MPRDILLPLARLDDINKESPPEVPVTPRTGGGPGSSDDGTGESDDQASRSSSATKR